MSDDSIVDCRGVVKRFGDKVAVDSLDLRVEPGQIFAFLGENGAGKTTTIRLMLGLMAADAGEVRLFGQALRGHRRQLLARTGALIEFPSFYGHLSGRENVELVRRLRGADPSESERVLDVVRLSGDAHRRAKHYSQGMKQRLAVAMALIGSPQLVILDEPTNGLDPEGIREIRRLIQRLPQETGATVFLSSHLLAEVEQTATHVAIIKGGRLLFQGSMDDLAQRQAHQGVVGCDRPEEAAALLSQKGWAVTLDEDELLIDCTPQDLPVLGRQLIESGLEVSQLWGRRRSLEDLYFALTEGGTLR
ncbi:MAG TPA: ABC transporter ATP-binding protein [Acidobacteriota bacterium]|nr:ABC transporter ATP-binding protein [Acidobacteriota bacterium]